VLRCIIRSTVYLFGLAALAFAPGCGGDPDGSGDEGDGSETPGGGADAPQAPDQFTLEGRSGPYDTASTLRVIEGTEDVVLTVRGGDGADDLLLLYATFNGVEAVVGSHHLDIGTPGTVASAAGMVDGVVYYSLRGQLDVDVAADGHAGGRFDMALATDDGSGPPTGAPGESIAEALTLSGSFNSHWTLNCTSGFAGGHIVADSAYCNGLTF
jgi:hypothetical protein